MTKDEATRHSQQMIWDAQAAAQHAWAPFPWARAGGGVMTNRVLCGDRGPEGVTFLCCELPRGHKGEHAWNLGGGPAGIAWDRRLSWRDRVVAFVARMWAAVAP